MNKFYRHIRSLLLKTSIKKKLMVITMSVSFAGLVVVGSSILIREVISLNKIQQIDMQVLAEIMANNTSAYLMFEDDAGAKKSNTVADVTVQVVDREIVFYSSGELIGLNVSTVNENNILDRKSVV